MFVYRLSPPLLPFPSLSLLFFPQTESLFTGYKKEHLYTHVCLILRKLVHLITRCLKKFKQKLIIIHSLILQQNNYYMLMTY